MTEHEQHQDQAGQAGPADDTDAAEAELIKKVLRTQERHREGGIDPELAEGAGDPGEHHDR
ncbi:MAG TPA: hypothetical protein VF843_15780 [Streptosporangiaceae bacterium]